jgi:hypothetical protein
MTCTISSAGQRAFEAAAAGLTRFKIALGRLPEGLEFADQIFNAIHASNVLHFLTPSQLVNTVAIINHWLRPGGRAFIQVCSPYAGNYRKFIPVYEAAKRAGKRWPGFIADSY